MARRKYVPGEHKYVVSDHHERGLALAIFKKHGLHAYTYKRVHRQTFFCADDEKRQKECWAEFTVTCDRLRRFMNRAYDKFMEKHFDPTPATPMMLGRAEGSFEEFKSTHAADPERIEQAKGLLAEIAEKQKGDNEHD